MYDDPECTLGQWLDSQLPQPNFLLVFFDIANVGKSCAVTLSGWLVATDFQGCIASIRIWTRQVLKENAEKFRGLWDICLETIELQPFYTLRVYNGWSRNQKEAYKDPFADMHTISKPLHLPLSHFPTYQWSDADRWVPIVNSKETAVLQSLPGNKQAGLQQPHHRLVTNGSRNLVIYFLMIHPLWWSARARQWEKDCIYGSQAHTFYT